MASKRYWEEKAAESEQRAQQAIDAGDERLAELLEAKAAGYRLLACYGTEEEPND